MKIIEILADMKFTAIYYEHENEILEKRKEFEPNIDAQKTTDIICRQLCHEDDESEIRDFATRFSEPNPFEEMNRNPNAAFNEDLLIAMLKNLGALHLHVIHHNLSSEKSHLH